MGNRVSTSVTPFSLEDLEAIARGSPINTATAATATPAAGSNAGTSTYALFDAVAADLAAALTSPPTGGAAARKTPTPTLSDNSSAGAGAGTNATSNSTVHLRKENLRAEMELQFADVDTSLHALRCVPDFSRGRRLPLLGRPATPSPSTSPAAAAVTPKPAAGPAATSGRRGSRYSDPAGSASDVGLDVEEGAKAAAAAGAGTSGRGAAKRRASSVRCGTATASATAAAPVPSLLGSAESPRSWIFRDVAVQPVDLTQAVDIGSSEVYVVVLVQRTSAANSVAMSAGGAGPASAGHHSTVSASQSLPASGAGAAGAACGTASSALHGTSSGGTRAGKSGRAPGAAASGNNTSSSTTPASGQAGGGAEWPREMTHAFTPRGLSTPFSSDINRASCSGSFYPSTNAAGGNAWGSPTATPRTSGSASNRPTPRSGVTTAATGTGGGGGGSASVSPGSPRSASSLATPRRSGFHYSIHLLTGTQADALTAAAGVLVARAIEKLFFECPDFDRRLFYHVNLPKAEETIRAYHFSVSPPEDAAHSSGNSVSAARGSSKASGVSDGAAAGGSTSLGKGIQRGGPLTSAAQSSAGVSQSSSSNTLAAAAANGAVKGSSLFYLTAAQEAAKELLRELLAYMRPVPVVVPRFERVASGSPASAGVSLVSSTASPVSVAFSPASPPAASFNVDSPSPAVLSNMTELFGVNALFRVLSGVRLGTPRWPHAGDAVSPLNSARFAVPGGGATSSSAMSSSANNNNNNNANTSASTPPSLSAGISTWHHELLPSFRPPRRGLSIAAATAAVAASTAAADPNHSHSANAGGSHGGVSPFTSDLRLPLGSSIWLQGPAPLDVHSATAAGGAGGAVVVSPNAPPLPSPPLSSPASTTPRGGGGRLPPTRPWSSGPDAKAAKPLAGHPFSATAAGNTSTTPQLPLLALGGGSSHGGGGGGAGVAKSRRPAPLNAPPAVTQTASPSLVTTPQQLTTQPRFSLPLEALLPKRAAPTGASNTMPHAAHAATYPAGAASGSAGRSDAAAAIDNNSDNNNNNAADRLCHAKHVRPRSHQPSTKKGAEAAKAGSPLKKRRSQDQGATEPATSALSFSIDVPRRSTNEVEEDYNEVSNQQERAQRLKAAQPEVTEVLPYLFVGGETAARDRAQLLAKGITHIVNTVSWCLDSFYPDAFHYFALSLSDAADEPIFSLFAVVNAFVERAQSSASGAGGRVFIHCQQGVSRSCTFVIAYVMWKLGMCYDRAYELVRARRNVCSPNTGFLMNLRLWEAHLTTPQLNTIYVFAPYTTESPTPFVYQLALYYTCESDATTDAVATTQESRDHYYQLCADVLRRAVDHREGTAAAAADKISLDPRLCHVLIGAPRKVALAKQAAASAAAVGASGTEDEDAAGRIEACLLVGPACTEEPYSQLAIAAYGDFVRYGFYHGEAHTSTDNAGRVIRFAPLQTVHTNASPDALNPVTAAEAEALFARHVDGCRGIVYAPQPQWDALLGLPKLSARLARYAVEAQDAEAGESARHGVREAERNSVRRGGRLSGSTTTATTPQPPSTASPVSASSQLFRTSRHTPRTAVTRPPSHTSSTKCAADTADTVAATPSPPPPFGSSSSSALPGLRTNSPQTQTERLRDGSGAALQLHMPHSAGLSSLEGNGDASLTLDKGCDGQAERLSLQQCDNDAAAAAPAPPQVARHAVKDCAAAAPHSLTMPATESCSEVHASHVVADGGDSFAFMYPFDAASRVVIADLDDLEPDQCYVVGFQQPSGVSAYLWRGAESPLEVQDVVDAFVRELLAEPSDAEGIEQLREAMANLEWTGCSLRVPVHGGAAAVLPHVRLLFVEQADEPEEFMTLL